MQQSARVSVGNVKRLQLIMPEVCRADNEGARVIYSSAQEVTVNGAALGEAADRPCYSLEKFSGQPGLPAINWLNLYNL